MGLGPIAAPGYCPPQFTGRPTCPCTCSAQPSPATAPTGSSCCGTCCSCPGPSGSPGRWQRRRRSECLRPSTPTKREQKECGQRGQERDSEDLSWGSPESQSRCPTLRSGLASVSLSKEWAVPVPIATFRSQAAGTLGQPPTGVLCKHSP